jgi:nucleoside-diphosphate-sugar epimerase
MRVFIAGATGVLGRRLVEACTARGHEVVGLTRDDRGDTLVRERGGEPHRGDVLNRGSLVEGAAGSDVVVHAATAIPTEQNPDDEAWERNDRVRREGTENLVAAAGAADADRFVQQSVVWLARRPDGSPFDESAEPNPDRSTASALDAERIVAGAADEHGFDPVVLRCGWFYAHDTAHTRMYGERLLGRGMPVVGRGLLGRRDATLSFVHVDDAGRAFADAVEGEATGTFHVVDDEPTTYADFVQAFADRLGAPSPRRVPAWLARFLVDDNLVRLLTRPMPTTSDRFREAFDWSPEYPSVEVGLDDVVAQWRADGTLRETGGEYEWTGE